MSDESVAATYPFSAYESVDPVRLTARIQEVRRSFGSQLLILGHHYQCDDVIALSDLRGDSYQLSALAASHGECRAIVFCGVHFMAETADILANRPEQTARRGVHVPVVLPDMTAGCSMADMADIAQVERCWKQLGEVIDVADVTPVTYVNSAANLKAFCGRHGGIVCTSSNAASVLKWSFAQRRRVLFFPDQHLGRNTAKAMGISLDEMPLWDPAADSLGGNSAAAIAGSRVILWSGFCNVHQIFLPEHIDRFRAEYPGIKVVVHPECMQATVDKADAAGSTGKIIELVEASPPGTRWAIGTELHLVNRLKKLHPEQEIHFLSPTLFTCPTMERIDLPHLAWALENLAAGTPVNVVRVDDATARDALLALQRMLEVK